MAHLPTGTVTFLFTDVEGSTRLLTEHGERYGDLLAEHRRVLRQVFERHGGVEVDTQGDAFFVAFTRASDAVAAAQDAQEALAAGPVRVRMGVHTGEPRHTDEGYVGMDVHVAARVAAAGHGGQVLVSEQAARLLAGAPLRDLGAHRLKDVGEVRVYQLGEDTFPPLKTLHQTNVPTPANPLVGRKKELADVVRLLIRERARVVTVTGPGGTGKTRFSLAAAEESVEGFEDGVWFVDLSAVREASLVLDAIGAALGARVAVAEHVGERAELLVLDNLEQVIDTAPDLADLVSSCPRLQLLCTSREPLGIAAEREYPLRPLPESPAVELFRQRADGVLPGTEIAYELAAAICERVDRLPLAIELAAARVKVLEPSALLERLERRLPLLASRSRDLPERQRTLHSTIAWSYELLPPEEQVLFRRFAVFAGGATLEAVEAVCEGDIDLLEAVVDKSLLRRRGERFLMLETIREYAAERLAESGDADAAGRRHAEYFLALAESANLSIEALNRGPQRHDVVLAEQHNLRAAIDWATDSDVELGLRLGVALENFWITHDPSEGVRRFASLLSRAEGVDPVLRARALRDYGGAAGMAGDQELAERASREALGHFRSAGDERGATEMIFRLGVTAFFNGDRELGRRLHEESLEGFRRLGDTVGELQVLGNLGWLESEEGNRERGRELTSRSLEMSREAGWTWFEAGQLAELAERSLEDGRTDEGERYALDCLTIARRMEDREMTLFALAALAWTAAQRGDADRAVTLWAAVEAEEARGGRMWRWEESRARYAANIPDAPRPAAAMNLDDVVEYALTP